ncbi:putative UDP-sugar transporter DDB_G0278631 isoform X2 [Lineus longissimus]|uniref:putative UDP-sugar transporter DDB_G0278631 isoform X2 n=1 Tax=Lineus longissimus TaxID=88925 RepID=UPI002B4E373A
MKVTPTSVERASEAVHSRLRGLAAALLYGACSTSMAFVNKAVLSSLNFHYPFLIMIGQMIFTILLLEVLSLFDKIKLPKYTIERGRSFLFPSLCYALNSALGLYALNSMNIPMYGVLKRCTPLVSLVLGYFMLKKGPPSKLIILSIGFMTTGCIIAGAGDLAFNTMAYLCGATSNVTQALYLVLVQMHCEKKSTVETLQLNSINTLPVLFTLSWISLEPLKAMEYDRFGDPVFIFTFLLVISLGCLLNYSMFLCTSVNSALTTTVVAMLKTVVQTGIGIFAFGGVVLNVLTALGILTNISGGILYTFSKYFEYTAKSKHLPVSCADKTQTLNSEAEMNGHVVSEKMAMLSKENGVSVNHNDVIISDVDMHSDSSKVGAGES